MQLTTIRKYGLVISILFLGWMGLQGQTLHFSEYSYAAMALSPANTGAFHGTLRLNAVRREQYSNFIMKPYEDTYISLDSPVSFIFNDRQWIGLGIAFQQMIAGDLALEQNAITPAFSYHIGLDKEFRSVIGFGVQFQINQRRLNTDNFNPYDELETAGLSSRDRGLIDNGNRNNNALHGGIYFRKQFNKKLGFRGGIAVQNIITSNAEIREAVSPMRINIHGSWEIKRNKKSTWIPQVIVQRYATVSNIIGALNYEHIFNEKIGINYKLGYRLNDAFIFGTSVLFEGWTVGINYDMTVSSATPYNGMSGALEIGVHKIMVIHPKVKYKTIELCPRL